jgi:rfaE bifunctional protein nucleotidyltransferase chain/domain
MLKISNLLEYSSKKIVSLSELINLAKGLRKTHKTVGLCHGGFDLLHPGHVKHFESAKSLCDILIVSVTSDQFVCARKGDGRPIFTDKLRAYMIAHLDCVDYVVISDFKKGVEVIEQIKPTYYIKGPDFIGKDTPGITTERKAIARIGGQIKYTNDLKLSTTGIIEYIQNMDVKTLLIILDRDGTIIKNDNFPGKNENWKEEIILNSDVINYISYLQTKYNTMKIVVSNQSGVARGLFDEKRVIDVNEHINSLLIQKGIKIDDWQFCPDVDETYVQKHPEIPFNRKYIKKLTLRKPAIDMVNFGISNLGKSIADFKEIIVIGNNNDDSQLAGNLNAKYIDSKLNNYQKFLHNFA